MPKLKQTDQQKRDNVVRRIIKKNMAVSGTETMKSLAKKIGINQNTMYSKMAKPNRFNLGEIRLICVVIDISDEDILAMIKQ